MDQAERIAELEARLADVMTALDDAREVLHQAWRELSGLQMDGHPVSAVILKMVDEARTKAEAALAAAKEK